MKCFLIKRDSHQVQQHSEDHKTFKISPEIGGDLETTGGYMGAFSAKGANAT
jgi:hypothetical protein